jgi:hypothetical protein
MRGLGALFLMAALLGLPRALGGGIPSIRARSVYVKVAPGDPELEGFALALESALEGERCTPARTWSGETLVVEIHNLSTLRLSDGTSRKSVRITVSEAGLTLPLVLDCGAPRAAARALLERLNHPPARAC